MHTGVSPGWNAERKNVGGNDGKGIASGKRTGLCPFSEISIKTVCFRGGCVDKAFAKIYNAFKIKKKADKE